MMKKVTALAFGVAGLAMVAGIGDAQASISKCTSANIKGAGKLAAKMAACTAKAISKSTALDFANAALCITTNKSAFDTAWGKNILKADCRTDPSTTARDAIKVFANTLLSDLESDLCTGGTCDDTDGISKCTSARMKAAGKKAKAIAGCISKAVKKNIAIDPLCVSGAEGKFSSAAPGAYEKAGTKADCETDPTSTAGAIAEGDVDDFLDDLRLSQSALTFTTTVGTANCGPAGLTSAPAAPLSGELDSNTACSTSIVGLGLGCLYFGGGGATIVPGGPIPDASANALGLVNATTLGPNTGNQGPKECTRGDGPGKHCANSNAAPACVNDTGCGGAAGSCADDANCYFGAPLPVASPAPFAALTTCVLNVIKTDASGTVNQATGASSVSLPLLSRVYITGNSASPCPKCISKKCDSTWKVSFGGGLPSPDAGKACVVAGTLGTTIDCRPELTGFQAPLDVDLTPLTTGTATKTSGTGNFCSPQATPGAFGQAGAQCIKETGSPAGDTSDGGPHASKLASTFCIPATGNGAIDGVADLPGPGAIGLNGVVQVQ